MRFDAIVQTTSSQIRLKNYEQKIDIQKDLILSESLLERIGCVRDRRKSCLGLIIFN